MAKLTLRTELDQLRCAEPGCDNTHEIVLHRTCHTDSLTIALYRKGELALECSRCGETYLTVLVTG